MTRLPKAGLLVVALGVLTLLVASATIAPLPSDRNEKRDRTKIRAHILQEALALYRLEQHRYPSTVEGLHALVNPGGSVTPFIVSVPTDGWGNLYDYRGAPEGPDGPYELRSAGPDRIPGTDDDIFFALPHFPRSE